MNTAGNDLNIRNHFSCMEQSLGVRSAFERKKSFLQKFKEDHSWLVLWSSRLFWYFCLLFGWFLLSYFVLNGFLSSWSEFENVRSFFSTIIPCQAGIIAIVITLTLIVVQINSASYPSRIVEYIIKKNPDFWIISTIYLLSIIFGLFCQKTLTQENAQYYLFWIFSFIIFSYIALIPYFVRTMNLIKSDYILSELLAELSAEDIRKENSAFQLVVDVFKSAISRNDYSTVRSGLEKFLTRLVWITNGVNDKDQQKEIVKIFCKNLAITSYNAIDKRNDEITREFIRVLNSYADYNLKNKDPDLFLTCVISIFGITKNAIDQNLGNAAIIGIGDLQDLTKQTIEFDYDDLTNTIIKEYLHELGILSTSTQQSWITIQSCEGLVEIGILLSEKKKKNLDRIIHSIFSLLEESIDKRYSDSSIEIINHIIKFSNTLVDNKEDQNLAWSISSYGLLSSYLANQRHQKLYWHFIHQFKQLSLKINKKDLPLSQLALVEAASIISINCLQNFPRNEIDTLISIMSNTGQSFAEKGIDDETCRVIYYLRDLFEITLNENNSSNSLLVVEALSDISKKCCEHNLNGPLIILCAIMSSITKKTIKMGNIGFPSLLSEKVYDEMIDEVKGIVKCATTDIPSISLATLLNIEQYSIDNNQEEQLTYEIFSICDIAVVAA